MSQIIDVTIEETQGIDVTIEQQNITVENVEGSQEISVNIETEEITATFEQPPEIVVEVSNNPIAVPKYQEACERIVITDQSAVLKYVTLERTPADIPAMKVFIEKGFLATYLQDYNVNAKNVYWQGYELDGLLAPGDALIIFYSYENNF